MLAFIIRRLLQSVVVMLTVAFISFFSSPTVHGWEIGQTELRARFIGLPLMLKLKRGKKPDKSGSDACPSRPSRKRLG